MDEFDDDPEQQEPSDPDWDRYRVVSRAYGGPVKPVGDPTRWGGSISNVLQAALTQYQTPQFARAQVADNYGRLWSMTGTVDAPPACWALGLTWTHFLEVTQGAGQAVIVQHLDLRLLTDIGLAVYARQSAPAGRERRSFAIIGGIIGQQWSARIVGAIGDPAVNGSEITTTLIAAPMAAGMGL
jgi:hypothetical protein